MNTNLLAVLKQMTARYGEEVLDDAERVKAGLNDLAQEEPKPIRIALVLCIESRGYTALKSAADPGERAARKAVIVQRVRKGHGTDPAFSAEALDLLEAALYGAASPPVPAPPKPAGSQSAQGPVQPVPAGFVKIPGGTFMMGSPADEPGRASNETQHQVTVGSFYMGRYAVTQAEWRAVMGNNPSSFEGGSLPVECVNWYDAVEYCNKRSKMEGLAPAYRINGTDVRWDRAANGYRLPTEAEWEYACRAGTSGPFSTGNNISTDQANYNGNFPYNNNAKGAYRGKTVDAGSFAPNAWGLYDMHGNVYEWCWDWYGGYGSAALTDPAGPAFGVYRVIRGASWNNRGSGDVRSAYRGLSNPSGRHSDVGFRLCIGSGAYNAPKPAPVPPKPAPVPPKPAPVPPKPAGSQSVQGPVQPAPAGFVKIPGGTFMMGSPAGEPGRASNETQHQVTVGSFYMSRYAVTQAKWRAVMGNNPSSFEGGSLPVECVNWYDAVEYCNKRSKMEGLAPAYRINGTDVRWDRAANGYRLPTEAEWEYACRAGTTTAYNTGDTITTDQANYNSNGTTAVGSYAPNPWGLYDMHGNVWEWCWDWYEDYTGAAQTDPAGPSAGGDRVLRGGSWGIIGGVIRSADRVDLIPSGRVIYAGFRPVRP